MDPLGLEPEPLGSCSGFRLEILEQTSRRSRAAPEDRRLKAAEFRVWGLGFFFFFFRWV